MKKALLLGATLLVAYGFAISPAHADSAAYIKDVSHGTGSGDWSPIGLDGDGEGEDNVVVPEPGTLALLGLGLASLGAARRARQARAAKTE